MTKSNAAETAFLTLLFNNTDWANIGDAAGLQNSAAAGSFYVSLHTADPGEAGTQATNETAYTNYARVAVARSAGGWTISGNNCSNTAAVVFPQCGATGATITHFGIGTDSSGAGNLLFSGALAASRILSDGITPQANAGELDINED